MAKPKNLQHRTDDVPDEFDLRDMWISPHCDTVFDAICADDIVGCAANRCDCIWIRKQPTN